MLDYIEQSDIVISFSAGSSVLPYVIISKKPLILCNFLKEDTNEYLERGLAIECNNPEKLDEMIFNYTKMNPIKKDNIEKFIENIFYKGDGQAGYRIAEVIIKLLENNKFYTKSASKLFKHKLILQYHDTEENYCHVWTTHFIYHSILMFVLVHILFAFRKII